MQNARTHTRTPVFLLLQSQAPWLKFRGYARRLGCEQARQVVNRIETARPSSYPARVFGADQDMAGRSRAKAAAIQILKSAELKPEDCKRPIVKQFHVRCTTLATLRLPRAHAKDRARVIVLAPCLMPSCFFFVVCAPYYSRTLCARRARASSSRCPTASSRRRRRSSPRALLACLAPSPPIS
eukprot:5283943-Pleurochrysis_carterae.AAC.8